MKNELEHGGISRIYISPSGDIKIFDMNNTITDLEIDKLVGSTIIIDKLNIVHHIYETIVDEKHRCLYGVLIKGKQCNPVDLKIINFEKMSRGERYAAFNNEVMKLEENLRRDCLL